MDISFLELKNTYQEEDLFMMSLVKYLPKNELERLHEIVKRLDDMIEEYSNV